MASPANDDDDLGKHLVIGKSITIDFKKVPKTSRRLAVGVNNVSVSLSNTENTDKKTRRWTLDSEIRVFPHFDDKVTLRVSYGKLRPFEVPEEFQIAYKDIADKFNEHGQGAISFPFGTKKWTVTLEVAAGSIKDIVKPELFDTLNPLLPEGVQDAVASGTDFLQKAQPLKSVLENIPISEDALHVLEGAIETIGNAHPLAKAMLTALTIPYKLLQNEDKFKKNVKDLAEAMHYASGCLLDVGDHTKATLAKELFASITKKLRDAALFVEIYQMESRLSKYNSIFYIMKTAYRPASL